MVNMDMNYFKHTFCFVYMALNYLLAVTFFLVVLCYDEQKPRMRCPLTYKNKAALIWGVKKS
jgi:uncharacterized protein YpmS